MESKPSSYVTGAGAFACGGTETEQSDEPRAGRWPPPEDAVETDWPRVSGSYRPGRRANTWSFPKAATTIRIHQVKWLDVSARVNRKRMACGEVEANLEGLVPNVYPYAWFPGGCA